MICPYCKKEIEPIFEDGRTTVPDGMTGHDKIIDMGSWWACPKCDEVLDIEEVGYYEWD